MKKTIVIIPAYNEEKNITRVLNKTKRILKNSDILVIDDCSEDNTKKILEQLKVDYVSHPVNIGYGGAVQTGLKYALNKDYQSVVLLDGDGQHEPNEVPKLIDKLVREDLDLVIGSRFTENYKTVYPIPFFRKIGMIFFSKIASLLTKQKIQDTTSGFQVFNKKTASFLHKIYPSDFPDAEIIILLKLLSFKIGETPVKMYHRQTGKSMITFFRSLYYPVRMIISIFTVLLKVIIIKFLDKKQNV